METTLQNTTGAWLKRGIMQSVGKNQQYPLGRQCKECGKLMSIVRDDDGKIYWVCTKNLFCILHGQEIEEIEEAQIKMEKVTNIEVRELRKAEDEFSSSWFIGGED